MTIMIFARPNGEWVDFPGLLMAVSSGGRVSPVDERDLIPLPEGATLAMMTEHAPIGIDADTRKAETLEYNPYKRKDEAVYAVAALLPQGFTRTLLPAAVTEGRELPLLGYTAIGIRDGKLMVAACPTDEHRKWHPKIYNTVDLPNRIEKVKAEFPQNRIVKQLAKCSLEYGCFTAQNLFYRRYEAGIPVSPLCNANCLGCISLSESECCPSPQQRIDFVPRAEEIAELAIAHLGTAKEGIISFGQGCEGEPSLQAEIIAEAISLIRKRTDKGTLNINTNGGDMEKIKRLIEAGMDSFRVSIFSPLDEEYAAYHRPHDFTLADVRQSLKLIHEAGRLSSLNLLTYPGFTDDKGRLQSLTELAAETGVGQIQFRNLNIDPARMADFCAGSAPVGIRTMIEIIKEKLPHIAIGNYSRTVK